MKYIRIEGEELVIGALSTHTEIERSKEICEYLPSLSAACGLVGSPQIRNMGTIGGSICNASLAADPVPPLLAAEAVLVIGKREETRNVLLEDFYLGSGKTALGPGEYLQEIRIPIKSGMICEAFEKLGRRKALAISILNAAVRYTVDEDGKIDWVRVAPGCIFSIPQRSLKAEEMMIGKAPSKELFCEAGKAVSDEMIEKTGVRWSTAYKQPAIEGVIEKVLAMAAGIWEEM
jgi:carbon-monoxide dehydrogenase medium subunit/xanthine dehydrogenase FAD-binding subunit